MKHRPMLFTGWSLLVASLALWGAGRPAAGQQSLGDLTGPWQLFVDDYLVESKSNVSRTYHPFEKYAGNPVLTPTKPWEDSIVYIYGTVLPTENGAGYRMWYHTMRPEDTADDGSNILYATSMDGISWEKPNLYINSWHGSNANNMIFNRPTISGLTSVMHTPFEADPNKRYKLFNYEGTYFGAWSADGIHTTDVPNNPLISGVGDVGMACWDPHLQRYLAHVKVNTYVNGLKRRSVALCTSNDFQTWTAPELVLEPDTYDDRWVPAGTVQRTHFYGLCCFPYESMYIGILWIFRATDVDGYTIGPVYAEIVTSHDGVQWTREEGTRPAMLALGAAGAWDDGQLYTAIAPVFMDGKLAIYYGACDDVHGTATKRLNCNIGLATLRKDGFASLDAGATAGSVTTKNLYGLSGQLHINHASSGGWVKVEVLDANGAVVPGYSAAECVPVQGDSTDEVVIWNTRTELPANMNPMRLRFVLQNASIYSFKTATPVVEPPSITKQPADQMVSQGGSATFTIQASGSPPLAYRWQKNSTDLSDGGRYSGTGSARLMIANVDSSCAGEYACVVSNPYGTAASNLASLMVSRVQLTGLGVGTTVTGVTADGTVLCGTTSASRAFIWSATDGLKVLPLPSGATTASAVGVGMYNGQVVVAINTNAASYRAKQWEGTTAGTGTFTSLPKINGTLEWTATGLGSNGTSDFWISGFAPSGGDGGGRKAGRYARSTNTTVSFTLPTYGHDNSDFHAVADNGWCGGQYQYKGIAPGGGARNAMAYVSGSQCTPLNTLLGAPSTSVEAIVKAMSRDGKVRGGWSYYPGGGAYQQPAVWVNSVTPAAIPFIPGGDGDNWGEVLALNGDGSVAGGYSRFKGAVDGPNEALIWNADDGTQQYQGVLTGRFGLNLSGWMLRDISGMSSDASVVVGNGLHDGQVEAWVVSLVADPLPSIAVQPEAVEVCAGSTASFTVEAGGLGPFGYEWQFNGSRLTDVGHYSGAATSTLTVSSVDETVVGAYRCIVTNVGGAALSESVALGLRIAGWADLDGDCDVDLDDFAAMTECMTGPGYGGPIPANCGQGHFAACDRDDDGDVDQADFGAFQRCYSGARTDVASACIE